MRLHFLVNFGVDERSCSALALSPMSTNNLDESDIAIHRRTLSPSNEQTPFPQPLMSLVYLLSALFLSTETHSRSSSVRGEDEIITSAAESDRSGSGDAKESSNLG